MPPLLLQFEGVVLGAIAQVLVVAGNLADGHAIAIAGVARFIYKQGQACLHRLQLALVRSANAHWIQHCKLSLL